MPTSFFAQCGPFAYQFYIKCGLSQSFKPKSKIWKVKVKMATAGIVAVQSLSLCKAKDKKLCSAYLQSRQQSFLGYFSLSVLLGPLEENAYFLTQLRTQCGPKYQKSPHCGPNAHFADLFGNTGQHRAT